MTLHMNINFILIFLVNNIHKMTRKLGIFLNRQMFAIFRLRYLHQYIIHFKFKLQICSLDIKLNLYVYYAYISEVYKDLQTCCQIVEFKKKTAPEMSIFFVMSNFQPANLR